jgi:hypothetical protein
VRCVGKYGVRTEDKQKYRKLQSRAMRAKDPLGHLLSTAKWRAKKDGLDYDLTRDDLIIPEVCPVFGLKLQFNPGGRQSNSYSLDRLDNSKGYVKGNVCVISFKANQYKGDMTIEEVEALLKYMKG